MKVDEHAPDEEDARSEVDEQKKHMTEARANSGGITQGGSQLEGSSVPQGVEVWVHFLAFLSTEMCL